jgi:glycosyltransferase involved in cell wall biosynthesis
MNGERIGDLPSPPAGRTGWPWSPDAVEPFASGTEWPGIAVVMPVLNGREYVEEAIRSVLLQSYPELEFIVRDGGSTDGTLDIVRRYEPWLTCVSKADHGQADAVAEGFAQSQAPLIAWLNADDMYLPGALTHAARAHLEDPNALLCGEVIHLDQETGTCETWTSRGLTAAAAVAYWEGRACWQQPGMFFPRRAYESVGGLDTQLRLAMDYDLLCRLLLGGVAVRDLRAPIAVFRVHGGSKTVRSEGDMVLETSAVSQRYWGAAGVRDPRPHLRFVRRALLGSAFRAARSGRILHGLGLIFASVRVRSGGAEGT